MPVCDPSFLPVFPAPHHFCPCVNPSQLLRLLSIRRPILTPSSLPSSPPLPLTLQQFSSPSSSPPISSRTGATGCPKSLPPASSSTPNAPSPTRPPLIAGTSSPGWSIPGPWGTRKSCDITAWMPCSSCAPSVYNRWSFYCLRSMGSV